MEKQIVLLAFVLCLIACTCAAPGSWERYPETMKLLSHDFKLSKYSRSRKTSGVNIEFKCDSSKSAEPPTSVHQLRPGDINVVAALGDSQTAGQGADAKYLPGVANEARGLSAMIGGDETLDEVVTLPNVLRRYNQELYGYSIGVGDVDSPQSRLNVADARGKSQTMPEQAEKLISRLYDDPNVDVESDWKVVSIFIGGNDLCSWCNDKDLYDPEQYVANMEEAIKILEQVPRMFVNVVGICNVYELGNITSVPCDLFHWAFCECAMGDNEKIAELKAINKEYQRLLEESITSGQFDKREDFTVVYQPFFHDMDFPTEGGVDKSCFSPDCFHFSEKGHIIWAIALWNNMIQPVGNKDTEGFYEELRCPLKDSPYLFTNKNSKLLTDASSDYNSGDLESEESSNIMYQVIPPELDQAIYKQTHIPDPAAGTNFPRNLESNDTKAWSWSFEDMGSVEGIVMLTLSVIACVILLMLLVRLTFDVVFAVKRTQIQSEKEDKDALKK
ncbi:phospholipase B1, membrane-associated-like [Amphiura filiformis]|uniref:phospholipase B1, membrane-associated-like n=1 Tax=Amphiura filiformis TaxID=82378 RepID=UPI003B21823D